MWRLALPMAEQPSADLVASSQPSLGGNGAILAGRLASPEPRFVAYRFQRESSHEAASGQPRGARGPLFTSNARLLLSTNSIRQLHQAHAGASFPTPTIVAQTMHLQVRAQALSGLPGPEAGLVEGLGRSDTEADTPLAVWRRWADQLWRAPCAVGHV